MGKETAGIVVCCILIITVFTLMCYLMSNVNPPPIVREPLPPPPKNIGRTILYDNILFDNPTNDNNKFKLWKPEQGSLADLATFSSSEILFDQEYNTGWTFPTVRIANPAAPDTLINRTTPLPILKVLNKTEDVDRETSTPGLNGSLMFIPVKRSVKEFKKIKGGINSVILKIVDDSGQFNIEIKIGSNNSFSKGNYKKNLTKTKPTLSMYLKTKNDDIYEEADLTRSDGNELNGDSVDLSVHDNYDKDFSNKTKYGKDFNQISKRDYATESNVFDKHYKDISNNGTFNFNITKNNIYSKVNFLNHNNTSIYNSTNVIHPNYIKNNTNVTFYTLDYSSTGEYNLTHDENITAMNYTTSQRGTTNNIKDYYDITIPGNHVTLASDVSNNNVDSKYGIDVNNSQNSNENYNATINRIMQLEENTTSNIVDYGNHTLKRTALYSNNNPYKFFFDNATEHLRPTNSKTFEFIDNALSKIIKKLANATKKYKGNIYGFTINDVTTQNMDIDNLYPMENVNFNKVDVNDNMITITEKLITKNSSITPFELSNHPKPTVLSLQIKKSIQKDNDTMLKINKSGKYKNLPIVFPKSKEFALDNGSDQGSAVEDTR